MFYNLELFGKRLREIRKTLKLNQKYIAAVAGIDDKTIRRIENGNVLPKLDTLEIMSPIYKKDLISLLLEYRFDDYSVYCEIKNKIELKLDNEEQNTLHSEFKGLSILLSSTENPFYKALISQLILFTEAFIIYKNNKNNNAALNKLLQAIKVTIPTFNLDNYTLSLYSSMEIRILMNIAFVLNKFNDQEKYLEIMKFCIDSADTSDDLYPKLCHNLSSAYIRNNDYQKALDFSNIGIESCQRNRNFSGLNILYYGKGYAEYYLGKSDYLKSLKLSMFLCESFGQKNLKKIMIYNCREILGINLED